MTSTKKSDSHLLRGIELSDVAQPRGSRSATVGAPDVETGITDRLETPAVTLKSGLGRKQKLGLGAIGVLGLGAITGGFAWAGVERNQIGNLRGTNKLLNQALTTQKATNARLQAQLVPLPQGEGFTPPQPAPAPITDADIAQERAAYAAQSVLTQPWQVAEVQAQQPADGNPTVFVTGEEELNYGNLTYADAGLPLFGANGEPGYTDIQINTGDPAAYAITQGDAVSFVSEPLAGAAGAIVATRPQFVQSLFSGNNSTRAVSLAFNTLDNPVGFTRANFIVGSDVLTDDQFYARGTGRVREVLDPMEGTVSDILPGAVAWFPLLQKQFVELSRQSGGAAEFMDVDTASAMQSLTGNRATFTDLTRGGDPDMQQSADESGTTNFNLAEGVLAALPSENFDANIANLVNNADSLAATFFMRAAWTISYLPNSNIAAQSAYYNGMFIQPAMGGNHIHVKTDDGAVNEIFFNNRPYVFLGAQFDESGALANISLADMTGHTIDCDAYEQEMAFLREDTVATRAEASWGLYGNNQSAIIANQFQSLGQPGIWAGLGLKQGEISLPYSVFKQLAVGTTQVVVPDAV